MQDFLATAVSCKIQIPKGIRKTDYLELLDIFSTFQLQTQKTKGVFL